VSGREIEAVNRGIVANVTLVEIVTDLINVGVPDDTFSESKKKRPRERGLPIAHRLENVISTPRNFIMVRTSQKA
jgi:hypothetical protein